MATKIMEDQGGTGETSYVAEDLLVGDATGLKRLAKGNNGEALTVTAGVVGWAAGVGSDQLVKVSSDDTTADYLLNKLAAGVGISITEANPGGDEDATIALSANARVKQIVLVIDGGGSAIITGIKADLMIYNSGILKEWTLLADQSGSIVIDIWRDSYANFPPTDADAMPGAGKEPTLSAAAKAQDTSIIDWISDDITAGDILRFNVDSASTVTRVVLILKMELT